MPLQSPKTKEEIEQVTCLGYVLRQNVKTCADVVELFKKRPELKKWIALRPHQMPDLSPAPLDSVGNSDPAMVTTLLDQAPDKQEALQALYAVLRKQPSSLSFRTFFHPLSLLLLDASFAMDATERDQCARDLIREAFTCRFTPQGTVDDLLLLIRDVNMRMGADSSWLIDDCSTDATRDVAVSPIARASFFLNHYTSVLRELLRIRKQQREKHGLDPAGLHMPHCESCDWFSRVLNVANSDSLFTQALTVAQILVEYGVDFCHSHAFRVVLSHRAFPVSVVELILQRGAPLGTLWSGKGETPLHLLVAPNDTYQPVMVRNGSIHRRGGSDRVRLIQLFLRYGANPNARDDAGRTPLHFSLGQQAMHGTTGRLQTFSNDEIKATMQSLIDAGANVNATTHDAHRLTPLMVRCVQGDDILAVYNYNSVERRVLLKNGARTDLVDSVGKTALHHAVWGTLTSNGPVKMLLDAGADPNVLDFFHRSPFHLWVSTHETYHPFAPFMEVAQLFVKAGADPNLRDGNGNTVLMLFAKKTASHFKADEVQGFVQLLLEEAGADPTIADNDGKLPGEMYPTAPRSVERTIQKFFKDKERAKLLEERAAAAEAKKANARKKKAHADNGATKAGK